MIAVAIGIPVPAIGHPGPHGLPPVANQDDQPRLRLGGRNLRFTSEPPPDFDAAWKAVGKSKML